MRDKKQKKRKLKPIRPNTALEKRIKKEILWQIYQAVFAPIVQVTKESIKVNNSKSALNDALINGQVSYVEDHFEGKFSAAISKELRELGAVRKKTGWHISRDKLPPKVNLSILQAESKFKQISEKVLAILSPENVKKSLTNISKIITDQYYSEIVRLESQVRANFTKEASKLNSELITVEAEFTPHVTETIAKDYANNLEYYVTDFSVQETEKLRQLVEENFTKGARTDELSKIIVQRFGVSERKADFLAKQETSLLTSTYTFARFQELGIKKYQWSTSHDSRVRHDHKVLDGKTFSFANPPVVDVTSGRRANPGEDFNCRCVAIPIIE